MSPLPCDGIVPANDEAKHIEQLLYVILIMFSQICQAPFKCWFQPLKCEILVLFFVLHTVIVWFWAKPVAFRLEVTGRKKNEEQSSCDPALLLLCPTCDNKSVTLDGLQDRLRPISAPKSHTGLVTLCPL